MTISREILAGDDESIGFSKRCEREYVTSTLLTFRPKPINMNFIKLVN